MTDGNLNRLKEKSRLISHSVEQFLLEWCRDVASVRARACQNPPPPMVFWMLRNQYRWGRVTGPYVSTTRCCTFQLVKPKPRSSGGRGREAPKSTYLRDKLAGRGMW